MTAEESQAATRDAASSPDLAAPAAVKPPGVVVIGAGFGGLEVAKALGRAKIGVTLIDRHNHHLFQPLLYQVATAALSASEIAEPARRILWRYRSVDVVLGTVVGVDRQARMVELDDGTRIPFSHLVVATGARTGYFGHDEWAEFAPGLKTLHDAQAIRSRLLMTFEKAEKATDPEEQRRLMTIAVIGGGPTGVELAGSIGELRRHTLVKDFRNIRTADARVLLVEAGPRVLPGFSEDLSRYALRSLEALGVSVRTGTTVEHIGPGELRFGGERLQAGLVIWAAGVAASPLGAALGVATDRAGRVPVDQTLRVPGAPDIFAIGDIAAFTNADGKLLPGLAQVAKQQGGHLGRGLARLIMTGRPLTPFVYRSRGNTAIIGRHAAVFEQGRFVLKGFLAWSAWALIHVYLLVGFQHRLTVSIHWLWRYLTYERGARIIRPED